MTAFASPYWNLTQASAWVVYRSQQLIEDFKHPTQLAWAGLILYPNMHPHTAVAALSELGAALGDGRLAAWGIRQNGGTGLEPIPPVEWSSLHISLPAARRKHPVSGEFESWRDIRLESKELKKLWRSISESEGRSKFDWNQIRPLWDEVVQRLPDASQNERVVELQGLYRDRLNKEPPSRSSIQTQVRRWR